MEKIFGLFLEDVLLGVMTENVFLSKGKEDLEDICVEILPDDSMNKLSSKGGFDCHFNILSTNCIILGDNGMATIEFRELNIIK